MTDTRSSAASTSATWQILELFKEGNLNISETFAALDELIPTAAPQRDEMALTTSVIQKAIADFYPAWDPRPDMANFIAIRLRVPAQGSRERGDLTKIAAECHRAKWQFDFNDENRLPVSQARDMVKRAFGELHRIGDWALKLRDATPSPVPSSWQPEVQFLLDRLEEFDPGDRDAERDFVEHIEPAIARLRHAMTSTEGK